MSRTRHRLAVAFTGILLVLAAGGPTASAQTVGGEDGEPYLAVRSVDSGAGDQTTLDVTWTGDDADLSRIRVTENGDEVQPGDPVPSAGPRGVVLVLDSSAAMDSDMAPVKDAATAFTNDLPADVPVALVSYNDTAQLLRGFTTDRAAIAEGIDGLVPKGAATMWDGIYTAALALEEQPTLQPNMVLISAAPDTGSTISPARAGGLTTALGTSLFAVGIEPGADPAPLERLVATTGGRYLPTNDVQATLRREVAPSINDQFEITYPTKVDDGGYVELTVAVGDLSTGATFVDGGVVTGNLALSPNRGSGGGGIGVLHSSTAKLLAVLLALVAVAMGVYAMVLVFYKDNNGLSAVLEAYADGYSVTGDSNDGNEGSVATSALIQRAVDLTGNLAERQGLLAKTEAALERAAMPLRAAEALFFYAALSLLVFVLVFLLTGNLMLTLLGGGILTAIPPVIVLGKAKKRRKKFLAQLPDTLSLLSGTLRAGYSLMQGVEAVSQEVDEPMGSELRRVVTESRLGRPLDESLEASAERMDSADFSWAVMAVRIQREVGGNLAELLMTVGDTMTQRERLRRDVAALTAEGKVSAIVLAFLPVGLGAAMFVINPEYISALITTKAGNFLLGGAVLLALVGFYWMKKCIEIEI